MNWVVVSETENRSYSKAYQVEEGGINVGDYNEKLSKMKDICAQYFSKYEKYLA